MTKSQMENRKRIRTEAPNLFRWQPAKETLVALVAGTVVVALSAAMLPAYSPWPWIRMVIRDIGQILVLGMVFPLIYMKRSGKTWAHYGFALRRWPVFLTINLILGLLLLFLFVSESPPPADFRFDPQTLWTAAYVLLALCFELVFFYAFLRTLFEEAFGIIPSVFLTAVFYAFHHIGFQPEYGKLILVGLLYATVFRMGNSILLIFPFFLGVGGVYDVLIQSDVVSPILYPELRSAYLIAAFCLLFYLLRWYRAPPPLATS